MVKPPIRYSVILDEEGYPVFDGLRVTDDELIRHLLTHLRREDPSQHRSGLVTECEGEICRVQAFDAPLVAQSVDDFTAQDCEWIFPGDYRVRVPYASMETDPWNRIHAPVGPESIDAVCSRKAQARLLNHGPIQHFNLEPYWRDVQAVHKAEFWTQAMDQKNDGWETGKVSAVIEKHFPSFKGSLKKGARILVPGAGRGHEAVFLETCGFEVTAVDLSRKAFEDFSRAYPKSKVKYQVNDLQALQGTHQSFDAVCENTFLCALSPSVRMPVLDTILKLLSPLGFWFGAFQLFTRRGGPPFPLTQWELRELIKKQFSVHAWEISPHSKPERAGQELWGVFQKRDGK